jgi:hypothetical protein
VISHSPVQENIYVYLYMTRFDVMILDVKSLQFIPDSESWKQAIKSELGCTYSDDKTLRISGMLRRVGWWIRMSV